MDYQTKINNCTHCNHGSGIHSISINIENNHVQLDTWGYGFQPGIVHDIALFDMTPELMYELAGKIIDVANKIVSEENKSAI